MWSWWYAVKRSVEPLSSTHSQDRSRPGVTYREQDAKTITRVPGMVDAWFLGRYGMNLYRGCEHGCLYCDGRAERYYVEGDFARDIMVKRNAVTVLDRELERIREPGFVFVGGGVCDAYQPAEAQYRLARGALALADKHRLPVHVLTKSALVERDLDLLQSIHGRTRAILSFSIGLVDEATRERFEPAAAPLAERWRLLAEAKRRGLSTGVMIMPVLPGISDRADTIDALVDRAADHEVDFVLFGGLTLRPGRQKDGYLAVIREHHAEHTDGYDVVYRANRRSGAGDPRYYRRINRRYANALSRCGLPGRIPRALFRGLIPRYAEAAVLLEHRELEQSLRSSDPCGPTGRLAHAGLALQRWARERFAKNRRRAYDWRAVELELEAMVADRTVLSLPGMVADALPILDEVLVDRSPLCFLLRMA